MKLGPAELVHTAGVSDVGVVRVIVRDALGANSDELDSVEYGSWKVSVGVTRGADGVGPKMGASSDGGVVRVG